VDAAGTNSVRRLELLASAIAGRTVEVALVEPGDPAWSDGVVVWIDGSVRPADQIRAVMVQASLLAAGSLASEVVDGLHRRNTLTRRYLTLEGHRALAAQDDLLPAFVRTLIDHSVAGRSDSPAASLTIAASHVELPELPPVFGTIRRRRLIVPKRNGVADEAARHIPRRERGQILRELDDGEDTERTDALDLFNPVGGHGTIGRLLQKMLGSSRSKGSGQPGAEMPTRSTKRGGRVAPGAAVSSARALSPDDVGLLRHRGATYPEWNVHDRRYRHDWCTVLEVDPESGTGDPLNPPDTHALRRPLARLGMDLERRHRQLQGDDLDVDATVEARVALAAGTAPHEAIYVDSVRRRRDLSVLILLDVSGSAGQPSATGVTVHEHQRLAAAGLTTALHDLGDRVALYGFRSQGRAAVQIIPVKRFGDRCDAAALRRLGGLLPGAYTRLGAAIRHGASVLEAEGGTARRLLVVLSDGIAYDHGYEGGYGEADARRALAEARRRGTACLCLSIGAGADAESLRRVFGSAAHAGIPRSEDLATAVGTLFRTSLRLAEVQRRISQRKVRTRERLRIERRTA
jgi:hypothetical protein